jgi:hypothetical protein
MIKRLASSAVLTALFLLISNLVYADLYWVYIDNIGKIHPGQEAGQTEKGDVVAICPFSPQYNPSVAELQRYFIVVSDLTEEEKQELLQPFYEGETIVKIRKRKITLTNINGIKQKDLVDVQILKNNTVIKLITNK